MSRTIPLASALALALVLAAWPATTAAQAVPDPLPPPPPPPLHVTTGHAPPPPPPAAEAPVHEPRTGFSVKLSLGGTYRNLYGIHLGGGDLELSLGGQTRGAAFYADIDVFLGSTVSGLTTSDVMIGFRAEGRIGSRLRIGGGASVSLLIVRRITTESAIFDFTLGPALHASFDVVQWEDTALYVGLRGGIGWLVFASGRNSGIPLMGNATAALGFRY